jgi:hypothetical protein
MKKAYKNQQIFNDNVDSEETKTLEPTHKWIFIDLCSKWSEKERETI